MTDYLNLFVLVSSSVNRKQCAKLILGHVMGLLLGPNMNEWKEVLSIEKPFITC